jgi:homoserine O-succinyltransferase/O-acetyltransferase
MAGHEDQKPMPIKIPKGLPACSVLEMEGIEVADVVSMTVPYFRPLRIGLLNLMPNKIQTETQFARLLGATPLQVELTLVKVSEHIPRHTTNEHLASFYQEWADVKAQRFDGFIITGAPIETIPFEEVSYWRELTEIFRWTQTNVHSSFNICWGAQAAMHYFHGMPRYLLNEKAFGVFRHQRADAASPYLKGFPDDFTIPVSRWMEMRHIDIPVDSDVSVLMDSPDTGLCLLNDPRHYALHIFNHIEYDAGTLADEYFRDRKAGKSIHLPRNYFPGDCETRQPENQWRNHAHLLFGNWIEQICQTTPSDPGRIGHGR